MSNKLVEFKDGTNQQLNGKSNASTASLKTQHQQKTHHNSKKSNKVFDPLQHEQKRQSMLQARAALPIASHRQTIIDAVLKNDTIILVGQTG
jgi:HrpA-like RNA helicase